MLPEVRDQVFIPEPWQQKVLADTSPVCLLTGSVGGGKSWVAMLKAHLFALNYPRSTVVIARKVRDDAEASLVETMKVEILNNRTDVARYDTRTRTFQYVNGSYIFIIGIRSKREREGLRSIGVGGKVDFAWMEESIEFEEDDFTALSMRLRGTAAPWNQLLLTTNPGPTLHWINRRLIIGGEASVHLSDRTMNPHNSRGYNKRIESASGIEAARLRDGLWIDGTGLVIDTWVNKYNHFTGEDGGGNVTEDADYIPDGGPVVLWADDGYAGEWDPDAKMYKAGSHPRVFILAQYRQNGQLAVFHEDHAVKMTAPDQLQRLRYTCADRGWPWPQSADHDKAAQSLRGDLAKSGIVMLRNGPSSVDESIKTLRKAVKADANGWRQLIVHPRCRLTALQFGGYSYNENGVPIKDNDDTVDAIRYGVWNRIEKNAMTTSVSAIDEETNQRVERVSSEIDKLWEKAMGRV